MQATMTRTILARVAMTLLVALILPLMGSLAWAGDVTPQQAQQLAQKFLKSRKNNVGGPLYAPGAAPQLTLRTQVSGLYVFNVSNNRGYVIVSNDDRTVPILGYSDSGSFDPDQMPDNMRAWLQGYADEIAWLKKQNIQSTQGNVPRRVGTHSTTTIDKLLTTTWDQTFPYNYAVRNQTGYDLVTGCVATAMAQVMYYTETKKGNSTTTTTAQIPAYTTATYGLEMDAIAAGTTINWSDMIADYSGSYTNAQAIAVANLMLYCGCSVEMNYGPSSGANTADVASALKTYFGYASTTQYVSRSFYSYANWTDLIYNELKQGRPVVYGGQAVDNGHCFVCDGYKYEDSEDLFHINWGWSGESDGYFVLSVLNPSSQGAGGSATNSAYNSGQEAIIGIQKIGGEGTVLPITPNTVNLTLNSTAASHATIALGESVDITVNVTNNSDDAYDGDICLFVNGALGVSKVFVITAHSTQNCVINFTPTATGTYTIGAAIPNGNGTYSGYSSLGGSFTVVNQTPTNLTASDLTYYWAANIGWTNVGGATKWNLRKRTVDITEEDFASNPGWATQKWSTKGGWVYSANGGIDDTPCYVSPSYKSGEDQDPDVGLCTPYFSLGGSISFYAWGEAAEHFALLLQIEGSTKLYYLTDFYETTSTPSLYTFDLSSLSGNTGRICINHCNSSGHTSASSLHVDNVNIIAPQGAWTTTEDVTNNPYALTALSSETSYEVQIQPVVNDGGNWSNSVVFTTISDALTLLNDDSAADPNNTALITAWDGHPATLTLSGRTLSGGDTWNTCCLPVDLPIAFFKYYLDLQGYDTSGISFKVFDKTNTNLTDGVLTLKFTEGSGTIAAGTPFLVKFNSSSSITIPTLPSSLCTISGGSTAIANMTQESTDGNVKFVGQWSTFDITASNIDEILYIGSSNHIGYSQNARTLRCFRGHFWVKPSEGGAGARTIVVDYGDGTTDIYQVPVKESQFENGAWYTLDGMKLQEKPTQKGVYIFNGRKVVIK